MLSIQWFLLHSVLALFYDEIKHQQRFECVPLIFRPSCTIGTREGFHELSQAQNEIIYSHKKCSPNPPVRMNHHSPHLGTCGGTGGNFLPFWLHDVTHFGISTKQYWAPSGDSLFEIQDCDNCCCNDFSLIQYVSMLQNVPRGRSFVPCSISILWVICLVLFTFQYHSPHVSRGRGRGVGIHFDWCIMVEYTSEHSQYAWFCARCFKKLDWRE